MIYTYIPYAPKHKSRNLGWAYNNFINLIPNDDDWVCFVDHDTLFTTVNWYSQLENIIEKNPEYGLFTCITNRVGQRYQVLNGVDRNNHNISYHREIGKKLLQENYTNVTDLSKPDIGLFSGVLILVKKSTWKQIEGCPNGFLGVDNEIHRRCINKGIKVGRMDGVYLYHWYRGDGDTTHLNP